MRPKVDEKVVLEHPGDPTGSKTQQVGLQPHNARKVILPQNSRMGDARKSGFSLLLKELLDQGCTLRSQNAFHNFHPVIENL